MAHVIYARQPSDEPEQAGHSGQLAGERISPGTQQGPEGSAVPAAGEQAWLGAELRRLRKAQGLSQRVLAQRLGYSAHSAIADYEAGRRVPANDVLIGYEGLFRLPAGSLQRRRAAVLAWLAEEQFHAQADVPAVRHVRAGEPAPSPTRDPALRRGPRWRRWALQRRVIIPGVTAVVLVAAASSWEMAGSNRSGPALDPTWSQSNQHVTDNTERNVGPEDMDGDDPRARDCVLDAVVRDTVPLLLPGGKSFGVLRLRHSARCGASWGSALYRDPRLYTVQIIATRPADGAEARSEWSNNTPPGSYGDMLSTAAGCVRVSAVVITPRGTGPSAATTCLK
jgi:transcriptional regulator with XRE-family HTH domain